MVLDMARPKYKKSTIWLGMRGRDAVRKSTLKVNILQVFTIDFSEIVFIVNHNSKLAGQRRSAKSGMNLQKKTTPEEFKRYQGQWYLTLNKAGKNGPMILRSHFRAAVLMKNRLHHESGEQVEEPIHPDQYRRWHPSSSTSWWDCRQYTSQVTAWAYFTSSTCHPCHALECPFFDSLFLTLFLSVFLQSFLLLPEPWAEPLPPCGRHRDNIPLALRQLRSLALWPKTPLSQVMRMQIGGQIPWNALPICETFKISCLIGRLHTKDVLEIPFKGPIIPFGSLVEYHPISAKHQSRIHQFGKKVLPGLFLGYALYAVGIWKGDKLVADIEELETMDASEIYSERLNSKEVIFPKENGKFIFPVADGRIKFIGEGQELRTSTLIRDHPIRGESRRDFLGESEGSLPPPPQDSLPDAGEAINDFWSMSGNFIYRHHVEQRIKLYSPREESLSIPLKYIDVSRTTQINLDVMQERRIDDDWNIDGSIDLSGSWTGFCSVYSIGRETSRRIYVVRGGDLTRRQATSRPDHLWPELWIKIGKKC